ncbi:hypothetical protein ACI5KX_03120 [Erythrobacter sp. GH1-10]|uniref:hypothetical protein n=1 Tax=Erythrobacter sp. GH1-10 TaxID=3349334 RepID=UPI003877DC47
MNTRTVTKTAATIALAATAAFGAAAPAMAGNTCKNVAIEFTNDTGGKIKIVDIDYWDPAKGRNGGWRSIYVRNEKLSPGVTWDETRNLRRVNQRQTKLRIEYRLPGKHFGWRLKKHKVISDSFVCSRRDSVELSTSD